MDKNKVLFLVHLPPPVHGSALLGELVVKSEKIRSEFKTFNINLLISKTVSSSGHFSFIKLIRAIITIVKTFYVVTTKRPQLCYFALSSTGFALYRDFILVLILKLFQIKIIYHLHNKGIKQNQEFFLNNHLYKLIFNGNKVIVGSKSLYSDIKDYYEFENVYLCPNGITPIKNIEINRGNSELKILYLSNLIRTKGILDLMASCELLRTNGINFKLQIVGSEGDLSFQDLMFEAESLKITNSIEILGPKFGSEKYRIFQESDIFVLPTYYSNECFPLVILEAMQFMLPVISTFEGGIPDLVDDNITGYLVKQNDISSLADRIRDLILNPTKRIKMGIAGRERFENFYTEAHFENNILEILRKEVNLK